MEFELLGGLVAREGAEVIDLGGPKQRAVLAALLLEVGRPVPADRLVDLVWHDDAPPRAESSLQAYVSNLRRALEPGRRPREEPRVLLTRPGGYLLDVPRASVDVLRFEDLAARGHAEIRPATAEAARVAVSTLDQALALWTGALLPELAHESWVRDAAERLARIRTQAIEDRVEAGLHLGDHAAMVPRLEEAISVDPYREELRAQLALALYRSGRQRDALASLDRARAELGEVGLEPGRRLRRLEQGILDQSPDLDAPPPEPVPAAPLLAPPAVPVPAGSPRGATRPFVGRDDELRSAMAALTESRAGDGRAIVIRGEAGIGKTRLVEELTADAGETVVAWARCPESATQAAYWPCIQLGRQLEAAGVVPAGMASSLLPDDDVLTDSDPMADRLALHLDVARVLDSATAPLLLVIDDLQWADPASLRVIEFLAGELKRLGTLLVVTVRPVGPDAPAPLVDCLAELARQPGAVKIDLHGLPASAIREWMSQRVGRADDAVADLVHDRTGGNAFFVGEVVELLAAEGRLTDPAAAARGTTVPAAVHDVVRRRVGRLSAETQQLLTTASVVGRSFDLDVLGAVAGLDAVTVLDRLEPALDAGLVVEHERPSRFQFAHALVADALIAELSAIRRARLHAATAQALSRLRGTDLDEDVAALAHHSYEGATAGIADDAYLWSVRAARLASLRQAHEDAAGHWQRAARAVELARPLDLRSRHEALLEAGRALLRVDAVADAYVPLVAAIELGLAADDPELIAAPAAAMNIEGLWMAGEIPLTDVDAVGSLQRAVAALPDEPTVGRALALGAMAENGYWILPVEQLGTASAEAVAIARSTGDREVLARTLHKRIQAMWRASTFPERKVAVDELMELVAQGSLDPNVEAVAWYAAASISWEEGEVTTTLERVVRAQDFAARTGAPALVTQLTFFEVAALQSLGEIRRADALVDDIHDLYRRTRRWAADPFRTGFKLLGWMELGDLDAIVEAAPAILESPYALAFGECIAYAYAELGDLDRARSITPPETALDDSWMFLGAACGAAHNRVLLGDLPAARRLRSQLEPYAGRFGAVGTGPAVGDVDLALARIAMLEGDEVTAIRHLDASVERLERGGAVPWLVRSLLHRHELTADPADLQRAGEAVTTRELPVLAARVAERRAASK